MSKQIDMSNSTPGYDGYPSSYDPVVFNTAGMAGFGMGATDDGYVGNATVTTNDPSPAGDLKVHQSPDASSPQIGGALKGAVVEVVTEPGLPSGWGKVGTFASAQYPAVVGYAALAYLTPVAGTGRDIPQPAAPAVVPVIPTPGVPTPPPAVQPSTPAAPAAAMSSTMKYGLIGGAVIVAGGLAYYFFGD